MAVGTTSAAGRPAAGAGTGGGAGVGGAGWERGGSASIKDVSRRAGVSVSTVSHVLNGTRYVSPELHRRVQAAIAQLGYRHNRLARSLRTRRSYAIGLIIPDVTNPYYPQLARGAHDAAADAGYTVFLCNSDRRPELELRLLATLEQRRVDGVLLDASGPDDDLLAALRCQTAPVVLVGSRLDDPAFDVVKMAPHGGYEAVRHLLSRGHRRIALIGGPPVPGRGGGSRPAKAGGYLLALEEAGLAPYPGLIAPGDYTRAGGRQAMGRLLALPAHRRPTAVFAGNDLMAIGALMAVRAAGLRVPQDVAIAGYDDVPEAAVTSPALTTVAVPKYEMGRTAAELLLQRIAARAARSRAGGAAPGAPLPPQHIEMPHHLVVRESA